MKRCSVILLTSAFLSACVSTSAPPQQATSSFQNKTAEQRLAGLNSVRAWRCTGAVSIQQDRRSLLIMHYVWNQFGPHNYQIDLAATLNLAAVNIVGQPHRVTLRKGNEPPISAPTPEELLQQNLGWSLPIPSLWYWARGLPAPGLSEGVQYDRFGHLTYLRQNGWVITWDRYKTIHAGVDLPQVIELHRPGIQIRVVIKNWQIF